MIDFNFKGIRIEATVETIQRLYQDKLQGKRSLRDKNIEVAVKFWDFTVENGNLTELALIKSSLQFYMQCYWKRLSRENNRIELRKSIVHNDHKTLFIIARYKNENNVLHISLKQSGKIVSEIYLDVQEIIMLDIALNKAINLLTPSPKGYGTENYITYPT